MKQLLVIFSFLLSVSTMYAGVLSVNPSMPEIGKDTVTVLYKADKATLAKSKNLYVVVYNFTQQEQKPYAVQYLLQSNPSKANGDSLALTARFVPKTDAVMMLVKITDGKDYLDNNEGLFWEIISKSRDGNPLPGMYLRRILSFIESLPAQCARKQDVQRAEEILQNSPKDILSEFQNKFLQIMIGYMKKSYKRDSLQSLMSALALNAKPDIDQESEVRMYSQTLRIAGQSPLADSIEKNYEQLHPLDEFSEDAAANRTFSSKTKEEFLANAEYYIKHYSGSYSILRIAETYVKIQLQQGNLAQITERFLRDPSLPTAPCLDLASTFIEKDSLKEALRWAERAVFFAKDDASVIQPKYIPECEFKNERRVVIGEALLAPAFVTMKMKNYDKSLSYHEEILNGYSDILGITQLTTVYQNIVELHDALANQKEAYLFASKAIAEGYFNDKIIADHKKLFEFLYAGDKNHEPYSVIFTELKNKGDNAKREMVLKNQLSIPAISATLKDFSGADFQTSSWKGKIVFIDFWATWCGPCVKSFPALQKLYDAYKNNPNVVFVAVNCWERVEDRKQSVQTFLSKNPYTFPIMFDMKDELVKAYGVTGIPTKFILDKNGIARFMEVGYDEENKFIEETTMKIEALLTQ